MSRTRGAAGRGWSKVLALAAVCLLGLLIASAEAEPARFALIIANSGYAGSAHLTNPVRDGKRLAVVLRQSLGFQVIERYDLDLRAMKQAMRDFRTSLTPGSVALVYYSGHGVEVDGTNYLLPIGFTISTAEDVPEEGYPASRLIDQLAGSGTRVNLLILDACRDNPLPHATKGLHKGLAELSTNAPATLIHYATATGRTAEDNSTYIDALISELPKPGRSILETFNAVGSDVSEATKGQQVPWMYVNTIPSIDLVPGSGTAAASTYAPPPPRQVELGGAWEGTYSYRDARTPVSFTANLIVSGNVISGSIQERNTFGNGPSVLYADLRGRVDGSTIHFTKTYDGTGGYKQSVEYVGALDLTAGTIAGGWQIEAMKGQFEMKKH